MDSNNNVLNQNSNTVSSSLNKYKYTTLTQIDDSIKVNNDEVLELTSSLKNLDMNIDNCIIKAPIDGIITINTQINKEDFINTGTDLASIIPDDNSQYKVDLTISNQDIANITEGQEIKYRFLALPHDEYGDLEGKITKIGVDAKQDQKSGISYYLAEASIENKPLYSYKGEKSELKVGMVCEAEVIIRKKKILYWLLEKFQ